MLLICAVIFTADGLSLNARSLSVEDDGGQKPNQISMEQAMRCSSEDLPRFIISWMGVGVGWYVGT